MMMIRRTMKRGRYGAAMTAASSGKNEEADVQDGGKDKSGMQGSNEEKNDCVEIIPSPV